MGYLPGRRFSTALPPEPQSAMAHLESLPLARRWIPGRVRRTHFLSVSLLKRGNRKSTQRNPV